MKKRLLPLLLALMFALPPLAATAMEIGEVAPDFELKTLEGKDVRLSDYRGRTILLKLATTWCPTCKQQSQEIKEVEDFLAKNNVAVIEVFLQDSEKMVRKYLEGEEFAMPFVALLDDGSALKAYNVYLIPRVLLIDREFRIRRDGSLISSRDLIKAIEALPAPEAEA